jgi:ABC-type Zn uptake system ZnuABC Zn-binding protein ZnuA
MRRLSAIGSFVKATAVLVTCCSVVGCAGSGGDDEAAAGGPAGCGEGATVLGRPLRVATTVAPITDIVANITAGTDTVVTGVVPEGINSHTYEPSPSVAATMERADVVFLNGLQLETPTRAMAAANLGDDAEICELGTTVLPEDDYRFDFSFPESAGAPNPHLWTNPPMVADYAALIRDVLSARDPDDAVRYAANHDRFVAEIDALDGATRTATASVPTSERLLLTYHDAYVYFADEYGWTVVGAVQPSSFDEPTPRDVADLIDQLDEQGVPAIFGSEVFPSPVLEQIASATGADYVDDLRDDDLPGDVGDPDHSWLELMRFNYFTMIEAFGGDASALRALEFAPSGATATYAD